MLCSHVVLCLSYMYIVFFMVYVRNKRIVDWNMTFRHSLSSLSVQNTQRACPRLSSLTAQNGGSRTYKHLRLWKNESSVLYELTLRADVQHYKYLVHSQHYIHTYIYIHIYTCIYIHIRCIYNAAIFFSPALLSLCYHCWFLKSVQDIQVYQGLAKSIAFLQGNQSVVVCLDSWPWNESNSSNKACLSSKNWGVWVQQRVEFWVHYIHDTSGSARAISIKILFSRKFLLL